MSKLILRLEEFKISGIIQRLGEIINSANKEQKNLELDLAKLNENQDEVNRLKYELNKPSLLDNIYMGFHSIKKKLFNTVE